MKWYKPINKTQTAIRDIYGVNKNDLKKLEADFVEAIEALESVCKELESYYEMMPGYTSEELPHKEILEFAYGKPWDEIKEMK